MWLTFCTAVEDLETALDDVFASKAAVMLRMRLKSSVHDRNGDEVASFADFGALSSSAPKSTDT